MRNRPSSLCHRAFTLLRDIPGLEGIPAGCDLQINTIFGILCLDKWVTRILVTES